MTATIAVVLERLVLMDSKAQSEGLAAALRPAGASAKVVAVPGESHSSLNKGLGEADDFATGEVDKFLASLR